MLSGSIQLRNCAQAHQSGLDNQTTVVHSDKQISMTVMKKIMSINPHSLMIGTDLPSTREKIPFSIKDLELGEHFTLEEKDKILFKNAQQWYAKDH